MRSRIVSSAIFVTACGLAALANAQSGTSVGRIPPHPYQKLNNDGYARFVFGANAPENLVVELRSILSRQAGRPNSPRCPAPASSK